MPTNHPIPSPKLYRYAKHLRKAMTDAEKKLWHHLRGRRLFGYKFRRQVPLQCYVLDFVCLEKRLIIEIDGGQHQIPRQAEWDRRRTVILASLGYHVIRFWNHDVLNNITGVLEKISEALKG